MFQLSDFAKKKYNVVEGEKAKEMIISILKRHDMGSLGLYDGEYPYLIPINHAYSQSGTILLHGSFEGKKMDCMNAHPKVCYEVNGPMDGVAKGEAYHSCHQNWETVLVFGEITAIGDPEERYQKLSEMISHYSRKGEIALKRGVEMTTNMFEITISHATARNGDFRYDKVRDIYVYDFLNE